MLKKWKNILLITVVLLLLFDVKVNAHGGNITGWKNKNSSEITEFNEKYFGYHKQDGDKHYHQIEWDEENQKWKIINPAVYYDENLNIINSLEDEETEKVEVKYHKKVDGDTAKFEFNGEIITVRFLGINTPETVDKTRGEEPYGKEASNFTEEKLENANKIEIEYDANASEKDKYERDLAWIWVDDVLLQEELVKNGLAKIYMLQNNYKYAGRLQLAEEEAMNNNLGLWSDANNTIENDNNDEDNGDNDKEQNVSDNEINDIVVIAIAIIGLMIAVLAKKI